MKYLTNAINFAIKNWLLILPAFVLFAIVNLISHAGSALSLSTIQSLTNMGNLTDTSTLLKSLPALSGAVAGAGIIGFIAKFIYEPATYGLVNKSLETGSAGLNDLGTVIGANFVKYVMYFIGLIVVGLVTGIGSFLVMLVLGLILSLLKGVGAFLMVLIGIAIALFFVVLCILLSMWFTAMVVDGLDVVAAAKKSIEVVKGCFWTVLGISLLIAIAGAIAAAILGILRGIPLLGPIIYSAAPTAQYFVLAVFYLMVYREKTGKMNAA